MGSYVGKKTKPLMLEPSGQKMFSNKNSFKTKV